MVAKKIEEKKFMIRRPYLSIGGGGAAGLVKDHTFTFFFWDPSLSKSLERSYTQTATMETVQLMQQQLAELIALIT